MARNIFHSNDLLNINAINRVVGVYEYRSTF